MCLKCSSCGDDSKYLIKDNWWGWVCNDCKEDLDRVDRETDWDAYEEKKRQRIAEGNEY